MILFSMYFWESKNIIQLVSKTPNAVIQLILILDTENCFIFSRNESFDISNNHNNWTYSC